MAYNSGFKTDKVYKYQLDMKNPEVIREMERRVNDPEVKQAMKIWRRKLCHRLDEHVVDQMLYWSLFRASAGHKEGAGRTFVGSFVHFLKWERSRELKRMLTDRARELPIENVNVDDIYDEIARKEKSSIDEDNMSLLKKYGPMLVSSTAWFCLSGYYLEGKTHNELAKTLNINQNAVKRHIDESILRLREAAQQWTK